MLKNEPDEELEKCKNFAFYYPIYNITN